MQFHINVISPYFIAISFFNLLYFVIFYDFIFGYIFFSISFLFPLYNYLNQFIPSSTIFIYFLSLSSKSTIPILLNGSLFIYIIFYLFSIFYIFQLLLNIYPYLGLYFYISSKHSLYIYNYDLKHLYLSLFLIVILSLLYYIYDHFISTTI